MHQGIWLSEKTVFQHFIGAPFTSVSIYEVSFSGAHTPDILYSVTTMHTRINLFTQDICLLPYHGD